MKKIIIDVEVVYVPLDYKTMLGHNVMYAIKVVATLVFHIIMFPQNKKVILIDQLAYHELGSKGLLDNVIFSLQQSLLIFNEIGPKLFIYSSLLGAYNVSPPLPL